MTRDEHAHARIDALQIRLAQMLSDLAINGIAADTSAALEYLQQDDDQLKALHQR